MLFNNKYGPQFAIFSVISIGSMPVPPVSDFNILVILFGLQITSYCLIISITLLQAPYQSPSQGGGGGVERDQLSDIRPPKKIKYQISDPRKKSNIRYHTP